MACKGGRVVATQRVEGEHFSFVAAPFEHQGNPHLQDAPQAQRK